MQVDASCRLEGIYEGIPICWVAFLWDVRKEEAAGPRRLEGPYEVFPSCGMAFCGTYVRTCTATVQVRARRDGP